MTKQSPYFRPVLVPGLLIKAGINSCHGLPYLLDHPGLAPIA